MMEQLASLFDEDEQKELRAAREGKRGSGGSAKSGAKSGGKSGGKRAA